MDKLSVQNNFKIYPDTKVNFKWKEDNKLEIELDEEITDEIDYLINV